MTPPPPVRRHGGRPVVFRHAAAPLLAGLAVAWSAWPVPAHGADGAEAVNSWEQTAAPMPVRHDPEAVERAAAEGGPPPFLVPEGFVVERLFSVPKDELGSWVCLAASPGGRLFASDQGGKGLVRIEPAPPGGSGVTRVERVPAAITSAQGLLWAFGSLYVVVNGPGSGLYRVTDTDGDDMPDRVDKLRSLEGGGEHGPHAIRLSPDGERLFVVCGNHTRLPFRVTDVTPPQTMGGVRTVQRRTALPPDGTSRLPANWDEDQIVPRLWDANGHAAGILAPGGFIASTDRDGRAWEVWSAGYRNPYDIAFNADGELFAYDADMEWDFGTPWYRPTRINHASSGSELGWRSGSGKWPAAFPDSLPPAVDIGPGSPVGIEFGYGASFPPRYQRALFACDWTFGTMYAVHLDPRGSTYCGTAEEFLSRTPLPLTDIAVGGDGCLYAVTGGRGGDSELFRVRYVGDEPTAAVDARNGVGAADRGERRLLEAFHRRVDDPARAVSAAVPRLGSADRFIRYAARIALEHQPLADWRDAALSVADPLGRITGAIAVARQGDPSDQEAILRSLEVIDPSGLDAAGRLDLARAYELAVVRLGEPSAAARDRIAAAMGPLLPSGSFDLDRELVALLAGLRVPGIVPRLVGMLASPSASAGTTNLAADEESLRRLVGRNAGYAAAVRSSLEKRSDLAQVHVAYALRSVPDGWSLADRTAYAGWFVRAREWEGGNSFRKFLANIEAEGMAGLSDSEKLALEATGVRRPYVPPPLPKPEGPGRTWSIADVLAEAEHGLAPGTRDFERGRRAYAAARCIVCHRFGVDGGSTGPDLTQAGGRFQVKDVVEALVEPSRVVSDQYRASVIETADGRVVTGRIVVDDPERIVVVTDPEDALKTVVVPRSAVATIVPSPTSPMPAGLLDQLNRDEMLDLVAYVLSRGAATDARFRRPEGK